jgi:hypothetical protein
VTDAVSNEPPPLLRVVPRRVVLPLVAAIVAVNAANAAAIARQPWSEPDAFAAGTAEWLLLTGENNPSTWLAITQLLLAAGVAAFMGLQASLTRPDRRGWLLVATVFVVLSLDESASLHEKLDDYIGVEGSGLLTYTWVLPALVVVFGVVAVLARFVLRQPKPIAAAFLLSGALFLGGGLVTESLAGAWDDRHGTDNIPYYLISTVEENLELAGVTVFLALVVAHARTAGAVLLVVAGPRRRNGPEADMPSAATPS